MWLGGYYSSTIFENNSTIDGAINWNADGTKSIGSYTRIDTPSMSINNACTTSLKTADVARYELIGNTSYSTLNNMPPYLAVYVFQRTA